MTKAKTTREETGADSAQHDGAAALRGGFEKAIDNYEAAFAFGRDTLDACVTSATLAGKGLEKLNGEIFGYSKRALEESIAAARTLVAAKSVQQAFEFQTGFAKSALETYLGEVSRFGELASATARESAAPLKGRAKAWLDLVDARLA
jgi:phasin family protein